MAPARHKHASEKVASPSRRLTRLGAPAAVVLTLATVAAGVAGSDEPSPSSSAIALSAPAAPTKPIPVRVAPISRSAERVRLEAKPPKVTGHLFATATVNVRALPTERSRKVGSFEWGDRVPVSGVTRGAWVEVVIDREPRWVHSDFLSETKPKPEEEAEVVVSGTSDAPCPTSDVESGLVPNAIAVHRAVCNAFPEITSYGGYRADDGAHGTGNALDVMVSGSFGWTVAEFVRANAAELGVTEVLYSQKIWTTDRAGEGWRYMEDRGSTTANHYDHVHVTVS